MGTWISHIRIAENLLEHIPNLDATAFAYGSLAPDSGMPNADWSQFDPPKTVTHFLSTGEDEGQIRDLEFYRLHMADERPALDLAAYSFRLGYFFHLICDNLWALRLRLRYREDYAQEFAEHGEKFIWKIKEDWYALDHKFLRDHPDNLFERVILPTPNPPPFVPFLPEKALHHQLDYIKDFYAHKRPNDLDRRYPFLSETTMDRFVADTTDSLLGIHRVLADRPALNHAPTAIAWLAEPEKSVYPSPVGEMQEKTEPRIASHQRP